MVAFARAMQWLFTLGGLWLLVSAGSEVMFDSSDSFNSPHGDAKMITTAVVGVGLLVAACAMAVTAGPEAPPARRHPQPGPPVPPQDAP